MRHWTVEERTRQAALIRTWKPWKKAGVKTVNGKKKSSRNALKHGLYSEETRIIRHYLSLCRKQLEEINLKGES